MNSSKKEVIGSWQLKTIIKNNVVIFDRDNFGISLSYNFSLNNPQTENDSLAVEEMAITTFESSKKLLYVFETDSTFKMTKLRSGGRLEIDKIDNGIYYSKNDTIYMQVPERNNYKSAFIFNRKKDVLYSEEKNDNLSLYIEFQRVDP